MKKLLLSFIVLLSFSFCNQVFASKWTDGYIIKSGDIIRCQIRTFQTIHGLCQDCLQRVIITKDSIGKETQYKSTDLDGFGFVFYKENYTFVPKVLTQNEPPIFMRIEILGKKLNLYSYVEVYGNINTRTEYLVEDDRKRTTSATNKNMKQFFADQPELLALYKQKVSRTWELPDFIHFVNSKM